VTLGVAVGVAKIVTDTLVEQAELEVGVKVNVVLPAVKAVIFLDASIVATPGWLLVHVPAIPEGVNVRVLLLPVQIGEGTLLITGLG